MFRARPRILFVAAAVIPTALACMLPNLMPPLTPTSDARALSTLIAGTAEAAGTQTQSALPPTLAPTAIPTSTSAPTATATPIFSAAGTALILRPDGSATFLDELGGYALHVRAGWLLMRVNEQEFLDAWALPEASDPKVQNFLHQVQGSDPAAFRLFGVDARPERYQSGFVSNFNVFWDRTSTGSLVDIVETLKTDLPRTSLNASIVSSGIALTSQGESMGTIVSTSRYLSSEGWPINVYQKQVVFRSSVGALTIVLSTTDELKERYLEDFDAMVDGLIFN